MGCAMELTSDDLWVLMGAVLVFLMQPGFLLFEVYMDADRSDEALREWSKPVAITVIFTCPSIAGSTTAPKMMFASSSAAS